MKVFQNFFKITLVNNSVYLVEVTRHWRVTCLKVAFLSILYCLFLLFTHVVPLASDSLNCIMEVKRCAHRGLQLTNPITLPQDVRVCSSLDNLAVGTNLGLPLYFHPTWTLVLRLDYFGLETLLVLFSEDQIRLFLLVSHLTPHWCQFLDDFGLFQVRLLNSELLAVVLSEKQIAWLSLVYLSALGWFLRVIDWKRLTLLLLDWSLHLISITYGSNNSSWLGIHLLVLLKLEDLLLHLCHHLNDEVQTVLRLLSGMLDHRWWRHLWHLRHHLNHLLLVHFHLLSHRISAHWIRSRCRFHSPLKWFRRSWRLRLLDFSGLLSILLLECLIFGCHRMSCLHLVLHLLLMLLLNLLKLLLVVLLGGLSLLKLLLELWVDYRLLL